MTDRALAACLIGLGLVLLVALVGAQEPGDKKVVPIQRSSLAVHVSLLPGKQESELELRVRTSPPIKSPPEVEFQDRAGGNVQGVKLDAQGTTWVGAITKVQQYGVGYIHVIVTDDSGVVERHMLSFATRGTIKNQPTVVYSVEGRFAFVALPGDVPADTRFLVNTLELPDTALPTGVKLEAGPFQIMATQKIPDQIKASVAIFLEQQSPNAGPPPSYQMLWLKPESGSWEVLPATVGSDGRVAQAAVSHLGMFVLTSNSK